MCAPTVAVCNPFPPGALAHLNNGQKCYQTLSKLLSQLPPAPVLRQSIEKLDIEHLRLLQWLFLTTKRVLDPCGCVGTDELITSLRPSFDFGQSLERAAAAASTIFLVSSDSGRGQPTSSLPGTAYKHGFHGTAFHNLHSILHNGLLNFSGMKMQRNGALYGQGVYLSEDFDVAFSFCSGAKGLDNSIIGTRLRVLLVCEVPEELHQRVASKRR